MTDRSTDNPHVLDPIRLLDQLVKDRTVRLVMEDDTVVLTGAHAYFQYHPYIDGDGGGWGWGEGDEEFDPEEGHEDPCAIPLAHVQTIQIINPTAGDLIDKYVEPAYADLMNLAGQVEGVETSAAMQSAMLLRELSKELHRLLPDRSDGTVSS